jgi:hypothetical protein
MVKGDELRKVMMDRELRNHSPQWMGSKIAPSRADVRARISQSRRIAVKSY